MNMFRLNTSQRSQAGFTLVEMLIVLALIALLIGMITPGFAKVQRVTKVTNASSRVYDGLSRARQLAMRIGHPILVKVQISTTQLSMIACVDADAASGATTTPGDSNPGSFSCSNGDLGVGVAGGISSKDSPFGPTGRLDLNSTTNVDKNVSLGYPALSGATFNPQGSNLGATGNYWFGFNTAGKLIPDGPSINTGASPIYSLDYTTLVRYPADPNGNTGGPEFYFAEYNASAYNAYPSRHVYRKVSLTPLGDTRMMSWKYVPSGNGYWEGAK
jgi:prepilin-type N-terminal cleavage/methylation domain-containing protein